MGVEGFLIFSVGIYPAPRVLLGRGVVWAVACILFLVSVSPGSGFSPVLDRGRGTGPCELRSPSCQYFKGADFKADVKGVTGGGLVGLGWVHTDFWVLVK